jgi:hypothetical protein
VVEVKKVRFSARVLRLRHPAADEKPSEIHSTDEGRREAPADDLMETARPRRSRLRSLEAERNPSER